MTMKIIRTVTLFTFFAFYSSQSLAKPAISALEKQIEYANAEFFRAVEKNDRATLEKRIANDAVLSGIGSVEADSKRSFLNSIRKSRVKTIVLEDWTITPQRRTVVVIGEYSLNEVNSKIFLPVGFMNVFVKRNGRWQVVASYVALINAPDEISDMH